MAKNATIQRLNGTMDAERLALRVFARFDPLAAGVAVGVVWGVALGLATIVLLLKGGNVVGPTLGLLSYYLPGYRVSWGGAILGTIEMGLAGLGVGAALAWCNNFCLAVCRVVIRVCGEMDVLQDIPS